MLVLVVVDHGQGVIIWMRFCREDVRNSHEN